MIIPNNVETKRVDGNKEIWRINKPVENSTTVVRSICVRDMGTDMTPIASQEPSRTTTHLRATTPVARSPISSGSSTPMRCQHGMQAAAEDQQTCVLSSNGICEANSSSRANGSTRRYREEVKIQAWENHEKRKAEMEMKKMELGHEKGWQTRLLLRTRRIAEEKRANAEAKLNEKAVRTSERADYIRRTGHLPSSFLFLLQATCCAKWCVLLSASIHCQTSNKMMS
ncbi:hypothetical protein UlMin_039871 [Ulmus minor]